MTPDLIVVASQIAVSLQHACVCIHVPPLPRWLAALAARGMPVEQRKGNIRTTEQSDETEKLCFMWCSVSDLVARQ